MKVNVPKSKYKIVLLGDQHVGKTAIINRFINNTYDQTYNATIGIDFLVKNLSFGDKQYRLQLWDTAGQERFKSLIPSYLKDSSCCLIVYDVSNIQSFENAFKWLELYNTHKNIKAISVLVGNKIDIQERQGLGPLLEEKLKLSKLNHHLVSAKEGTGIIQAFQKVVTQLDEHLASLNNSRIEILNKEQQEPKTAQALVKQISNKFQLQQKIQSMPEDRRNCCF